MDAMLTRQEVATQLQVSPDTVTNMVEAGELEGHDVGRGTRRQLRIPPDAVAAYLQRCRVTGRTRRYRIEPRATGTKDTAPAPWNSR